MPEVVVHPELAKMLLDTCDQLGSRLEAARQQYTSVLLESRIHLNLEVTKPFADGLLRHLGCKQGSSIVLKEDGTMVVVGRRSRPLDALRKEAQELGVDISSFGRKLKAIREHLDEVRAGAGQVAPDEVMHHEAPKRGFTKRSLALTTRPER